MNNNNDHIKTKSQKSIDDLVDSHKEIKILQGGMGVGVSNWKLAKAVSQQPFSQGVVSGTGLDTVLIRRLQYGDEDGRMKHAMEQFPFPDIAEKIYDTYFIKGGKDPSEPFKLSGMYSIQTGIELQQLSTLANFVEVYLAKEGHDNPVGINYLEKIQLQHLPSIYGAMLAGVDTVIMGAGIPTQIPGILDSFVTHKPQSYDIFVSNSSKKIKSSFDPIAIFGTAPSKLKRPDFYGIISSAILANVLKTRSSGEVNGFVIEEPTAGGHNAPPRGNFKLNKLEEPIYGPKDEVNYEKIKSLGLPFWIGGGFGSPEKLKEALQLGANGIQVGTLFSLAEESGISSELKKTILEKIKTDSLEVITDPVASPTGFPFKVAQLEGTISEKNIYENRTRICDLGYLRTPFEKKDGTITYRCPAEPTSSFTKKDGTINETLGRKCLCNGLMANIGLSQTQKSGYEELALITEGNDVARIKELLSDNKSSYTVQDVITYLLS